MCYYYGGSTTAERVKNNIHWIRRCVDDSLQQFFGLLSWIAQPLCGLTLHRSDVCPYILERNTRAFIKIQFQSRIPIFTVNNLSLLVKFFHFLFRMCPNTTRRGSLSFPSIHLSRGCVIHRSSQVSRCVASSSFWFYISIRRSKVAVCIRHILSV